MSFNPNAHPLAFCLARIQTAVKKTGLTVPNNRILHSREPLVKAATAELDVSNIPSGFTKFQLPFHFDQPSVFFFSHGAPNTHVPQHSHDEGDGLRIILSGSLLFENEELSAGDWMFIPKGTQYSFRVGRMGVGMFYCYSCCCA